MKRIVWNVELNISFFSPRWLNKLGLASIKYEPAERNAAAGEHMTYHFYWIKNFYFQDVNLRLAGHKCFSDVVHLV